MSEKSIFYLIKAKKGFIAITTLIFIIVGLALTLSQSLKYTSSLSLLVVQSSVSTTDPYAMSKSNEYLGQLLSKVAYSNLFFAKVLASDTEIKSDYFGASPKDRMKRWNRSVEIKSIRETGIISIKAYHPDRAQAEKLVRGVALTFMTQHGNYHGLGNNVAVRLLDEPITSNYPDQPNIVVNLIISLFAGLVCSFAYVYLKYSHETPVDVTYELTEPQSDLDQVLSSNYETPDYEADISESELPPVAKESNQFPWQNNRIN